MPFSLEMVGLDMGSLDGFHWGKNKTRYRGGVTKIVQGGFRHSVGMEKKDRGVPVWQSFWTVMTSDLLGKSPNSSGEPFSMIVDSAPNDNIEY